MIPVLILLLSLYFKPPTHHSIFSHLAVTSLNTLSEKQQAKENIHELPQHLCPLTCTCAQCTQPSRLLLKMNYLCANLKLTLYLYTRLHPLLPTQVFAQMLLSVHSSLTTLFKISVLIVFFIPTKDSFIFSISSATISRSIHCDYLLYVSFTSPLQWKLSQILSVVFADVSPLPKRVLGTW